GKRGSEAPGDLDRKLDEVHGDSGKLKPKPPVSHTDQAHVDARERDPEGEYETVDRAEAQLERQRREEARSPNVGGPDWVPQIDEVDQNPDER
ncbi:MAG TPA: hypothetical protein VFV47_13465, partial [Hyphomicrobiaceae bacterium]|nr:hypothetical protein [Hyphomicrobiaceae bacterium]